MVADDNDREALQDIINNVRLSEGYLTLARDVEVMEPKSPEDIYKVLSMLNRKNLFPRIFNHFINHFNFFFRFCNPPPSIWCTFYIKCLPAFSF